MTVNPEVHMSTRRQFIQQAAVVAGLGAAASMGLPVYAAVQGRGFMCIEILLINATLTLRGRAHCDKRNV